MANKKSRSNSIAPNAKGDLVAGTAAATSGVLAVGSNNQILTVDSTTTTGMKWSTPVSTTWTQRIAGTGVRLNKVAYNGTNLYVAVGDTGLLYSSPDGITWTSRTSGFSTTTINDVAFGNGLWVAVGDVGTLTTSTDGTTWTARTSNMSTNAINAVTYANSLWVAVGAGGGTTNTGGIIYSSNGTTWTRKSQSLSVGASYYCVVWNGTNWIVAGDCFGTTPFNNYLYATTPSGTWTAAVTTGNENTIFNIAWDGTRSLFLTIIQSQGQVNYSASTTLAAHGQYDDPRIRGNEYQNFYYYNNKLYVQSYYIASFTPQSTIYQILDVPIAISPATLNSSASLSGGGDQILTNLATSIWVGAAGSIVTDSVGRLYTSF